MPRNRRRREGGITYSIYWVANMLALAVTVHNAEAPCKLRMPSRTRRIARKLWACRIEGDFVSLPLRCFHKFEVLPVHLTKALQ